MRAVYVPVRGAPAGMERLEATAPAMDGGGMLTLFPESKQAPQRLPLTADQLRGLLRQWALGVRSGDGRLRVGD